MDCEHTFVFLRQEQKNIGYDRNPTWLVEDVFFCSKCLEYKRVGVKKERPYPGSLDVLIERLV